MTQYTPLTNVPTRKTLDQEDGIRADDLAPTHHLDDLRLAERIERALHATGYGVLRDIKVSVSTRVVRLVGRVPTYFMKQIAQVTALSIPGTRQIHNDLDVK